MTQNMKFKLLSGDLIPMVGFGSYLISGKEMTVEVLDNVLRAGYRLIDTAAMYGNEEDIGYALKQLLPKHNLKREDLFITSKLYPSDQGDKAYAALQTSLRKLDCGYLDLYLIHWPGSYGNSKHSDAVLRDKSWQMLIKAKKDGLTRNIGVSNYLVKHLKQLLSKNHGVTPVVNQVEWHPYCYHPELKKFCQDKGILLQAYSSLGGSGNRDLIENVEVVAIANKLGKSPAQVLLKWSLQHGVAVIPKSKSKNHLEENMKLDFQIPEEDMETLNSFELHRYDWDPNTIA